MIAVLSAGDAAVIAACISAVVGPVVVIWVQRRVHADNRSDHAQTMRKVSTLIVSVDDLKAGQAEIKSEVRDLRADVRDLKASDRDHGDRLDELEHPTPKPPTRSPRKKAS